MNHALRNRDDGADAINKEARPRLEVLGAAGNSPEDWRVGPYEIKEQIGQGGMATVYRAWHTGLHRHEALKIPRRGMDGVDTEFIHRLLSEARIAARLRHPHIVGIHNISEDGAPHPYFSMDLIEGENLAEVLAARGTMTLPETISILKQAASALSHAHQNGVVHRDIKPENILLQRDENATENKSSENQWNAKVVDFGISRAGEDTHGTRLTRSGILVGTPEYMSPEQSGSGEVVDARTDIYSLGVVAYEMLTGAPPFTSGDGVSRMAILISHVRDEPRAVHALNAENGRPEIPLAVSEVISKALAKTPAERFASADEFLTALQNVSPQNALPQNAPSHSAPLAPQTEVLAAPPARRALRGGWLGLGLAVAIGVLIGWMTSHWGVHKNSIVENSAAKTARAPHVEVAVLPVAPSTPTKNLALASLVKKQTVRRAIAFPKQTKNNPAVAWGTRKILQAGKNGVREVVLETTSRGGKTLSQRAVSTRVLAAPMAQIEELGTQPRNIDNVSLRRNFENSPAPAREPESEHHSFSRRTSPRHYQRDETPQKSFAPKSFAPKPMIHKTARRAAPKPVTRKVFTPKVASSSASNWSRPGRFYDAPRVVVSRPRVSNAHPRVYENPTLRRVERRKRSRDSGQVLGSFRLPSSQFSPSADFSSSHS